MQRIVCHLIDSFAKCKLVTAMFVRGLIAFRVNVPIHRITIMAASPRQGADAFGVNTLDFALAPAAPEPHALALLGVGLLGSNPLALRRRRG